MIWTSGDAPLGIAEHLVFVESPISKNGLQNVSARITRRCNRELLLGPLFTFELITLRAREMIDKLVFAGNLPWSRGRFPIKMSSEVRSAAISGMLCQNLSRELWRVAVADAATSLGFEPLIPQSRK